MELQFDSNGSPFVEWGGNVIRLEKEPITEKELVEKAEKELRETPELREQALRELRQLLKEETSLVIPIEKDDFLLKFLRPCKFYAESAFKRIQAYYKFRLSHADYCRDLMPTTIRSAFDHSIVSILAPRDQHGRRIMLVESGERWNPREVPLGEVFRGVQLGLESAMVEPRTQVCGVIVILDMKGLSFSHIMQFTPSFAKMVMCGVIVILDMKGLSFQAKMVVDWIQVTIERWNPREVPLGEVFRGVQLGLESGMVEPRTQVCGVIVILDMKGLSFSHIMQFTPSFAKMVVDWIQLGLESGMVEPRTQVCGVIVILDMKGLSFSHIMQFTPSFAKMVVDWIQDSIPIRLKAIHIVSQPYIFNMLFAIFKPFLREKLRKRIHFHGADRESLYAHVDKMALRARHGGDLPEPEIPGEVLWKMLHHYEDDFKARHGGDLPEPEIPGEVLWKMLHHYEDDFKCKYCSFILTYLLHESLYAHVDKKALRARHGGDLPEPEIPGEVLWKMLHHYEDDFKYKKALRARHGGDLPEPEIPGEVLWKMLHHYEDDFKYKKSLRARHGGDLPEPEIPGEVMWKMLHHYEDDFKWPSNELLTERTMTPFLCEFKYDRNQLSTSIPEQPDLLFKMFRLDDSNQ
ncbi:CRAL/TRIO domain-containing protein [Phthorimaea operculella]|nr:CRAL/TRIO domain-containing protein [Phthorimaea operculella]